MKSKRPIGRPPGYSPGTRKILDKSSGAWSWNSTRLWSKVIKDIGCWNWCGSRGPHGNLFGAYKNGKQQMTQASRLIYAEVNDVDITELSVYHTCNNMYCCNPDHMYTGPNQRIGLKSKPTPTNNKLFQEIKLNNEKNYTTIRISRNRK